MIDVAPSLLQDPGDAIDLGLKIGILILCLFYVIFAFVIIKQVHKMTETLEVGFESQLKAIAWLHLLLVVSAFFATLVIL